MHAVLTILAYCAGVVLGGALLAPPLYWAGHAIAEAGVVPFLGEVPFHRYFNRAVLVAAVAGLWPLLRRLGVRGLKDLGLRPNPRGARDLALGLAVSVLGLWGAAALAHALGVLALRPSPSVTRVLGAVATGAAVALIEEPFFRGALFGALRREMSWRRALALLSVFFAAVHFLSPGEGARAITEVGWLSGFSVLPHTVERFGEPDLVLGMGVTLVLFGWILGWVVVRTGSLHMALGLHAGWVFALRSLRAVSERESEPGLWLGRNLRTGAAPLVLLALSALLLAWLLRARRGPGTAP